MSAISPSVPHALSSTSSSFVSHRAAGFAGLFFAVTVAAVNVVVGSMTPPAADATAADIVSFFTANDTAMRTVAAVIPFPVIALFLFLAGSFPRLSAASAEAAFWARVGAAGLILVEVLFLVRTVFELPLIANAEGLGSEPGVVEALWQLQSGAMIFNGLALAVALLGLSRAGRLGGLMPAWQEAMGLLAAAGFFIGAMAAAASLDGSAIGIVGLPAFILWLVWLALTSIRLIRADGGTA